MQAVILAAGKSTRTYPLTLTRPKPLLKVANKTLLEHNLENLNNIADEAIIIVGYRKNSIKKHIGSRYKNIKIRYVEQKQQLGTGHAALLAEPYIKDRFILMAGDDIYSEKDVRAAVKHTYSILVNKTKNWKSFGVVLQNNGVLADFVEKPERFVSDLINTAFYALDKKIFSHLNKIKKSKRNEYEFPDALKSLSKDEKVYCVTATQWLPIVYPLDLLKADKALRKNENIIGKNSKIEGNLKNSSIGNSCIIKGTVKNSIVMDKTFIDANSMVEGSVIGENVYFNGKISASVIADNVKAKNVIVKPGCKIWPNKKISGLTIKNDAV